MLKFSRKGGEFVVETLAGRITFDARCGGQITGFAVKNELFAHELVKSGGCWPNLEFLADGRRVSLSSAPAEMTLVNKTTDYVKFNAKTVLHDGALVVTQEFEIHEEGAFFCNLAIETPSGKSVELTDSGLNLAVETGDCNKVRWGCYSRTPKYKRDYSTVHAFTGYQMFKGPEERLEVRELYPFLSLSLGWKETRFFSNHLEFFLEDWTAYNDGDLDQTCTRVGGEAGRWQAQWHFHEGRTVKIQGPWRYRNRWGFMFGRARNRSGAEADPAVRNNMLGSRICHCMYPYARSSDKWPWVSMPIKQVAAQPPQLFKGNPDLSRVDEAWKQGANTMIIHQFWMTNPGSNNEPIADYIASDPKWLKAFVAKSHKRGMRVAFYVRGTEMYQQFSDFFERFLEKDRDGLYADWNTSFCMGYTKCSPLHVSVHNYFHFTKALRRRVGDGGILSGHTGNTNLIASACFDVAVGGEFSVQHDQLLTFPESAAYYMHLAGVGGHLISGNLPDRILFSSPKAAAMDSALGMTSHPFMEPGVTFQERVAFLQPLWDAMNSLPGNVTQLHNPAYIPTQAVSTESADLYPSLWQSDRKQSLLLVTNMGEQAANGAVTVNLKELKLGKNAPVRVLPVAGSHVEARFDGGAVRVDGLPPLKFTALLLG